MLYQNPSDLPEQNAHHIPETDLRRRAKYLSHCKDMMWNRWTKEYVHSLREKHRRAGGVQTSHPSVGDVVVIQGDQRNCNHWKIGIVMELIKGGDGIIHAAKLRAGKGILERAIQHLYPLELSCNRKLQAQLNLASLIFRLRRDAATAAHIKIKKRAREEQL